MRTKTPEFSNLIAGIMAQEVTLIINTPEGEKIIKLDGTNFTVGRTDSSDLALPDAGLSRRHATFEQPDGEVWVFDENSTNGTFLNDIPVSGEGARVFDGDEIRLGDRTRIFVQIRQSSVISRPSPVVETEKPVKKQEPQIANEQRTKDKGQRTILIIASISAVFIIALAAVGILFIAPRFEKNTNDKKARTPDPNQTSVGQVVIDPIRDDPEDIEEILALFEVQEEPLKVEDVRDVKSTSQADLNVSQGEWERQRNRARAGRGNLPGGDPQVPAELASRGLKPQRAKMAELGLINLPPPRDSLLPRDFSELAKLRLEGKLIEMPLATKDYVLDQIGTSAKGGEFTIFNPATFQSAPVASGTEPFQVISTLASNFEGQKYNISDAADRIELKRRLLRSIRPEGKQFIEELARGYREKFNFPLLVTSLIRTLEYQYHLTQTNPNATKAPNPPHASGYTFDMAFNQMSGPEKQYIYGKLAEFERAGRIDALFEAQNCIHIFVYPDRRPPRM